VDGEASTPGPVDSDSRSGIPTRLSGWPSTSVSDAWTCWIGLAVRPARVAQTQWLIEQVLNGARMRLPD
jgi:hypothetical protein